MEQRGTSALPRYFADAVTRELTGHTYRSMDFAMAVTRTLVTERFWAHGQPQGVDLVAVARHARRAGRLFLLRDAMLVICFAAYAAGVIAGIAALVTQDAARLVRCLCLILCAFLAGAVLVFAWTWIMWRIAQAVQWGEAPPRERASSVGAGLERELDALDDANVIVYTAKGPDGDQPFLGSGIDVLETVWAGIDISRPAGDAEDGRRTVGTFTAQQLHAYVAEHVGDIAGIDGLRVGNRLYVQGHHVRDLGEELLPNPLKRPVTRIAPELVEAGVTETDNVMRTYLTLELVGSRGSYVVTVHLRARLVRSRLSWEISAYYLPPVHADFSHEVTYPLGLGRHALTVLRVTRRQIRTQLFGSARRMLSRPAQWFADAVRLRWHRSRVSRPRGYFDHGAGGTLRAAVSDPDRQWDYAQRMDAKDAVQRIQQAVLRTTEQFLEAHHIDTSDLRQAGRTINSQTYNFNGPINGQNIFGNRGINIAAGLRQGHHPGPGTGPGASTTDRGGAAPSAASGSAAK